jgi:hypothetical protein
MNRLHFFLFMLTILSIMTTASTARALTNLDYHLGQSKYGESFISDEDSFHGLDSAFLSVDDDGSYIRISVSMDEPLPLADLEQLSLWIDPQLGDGKVQLELFLDGDGSGSYASKSAHDARLRSIRESWSEMGMSPSRWNELDGFDLIYEKYGDKAFATGSLQDCLEKLKGDSLVRLYITIYKDGNVPKTSAFIDYIKIGDQIISFEPLEQEEIKDGPSSVSPGGQITYTITYGNNQLNPVDLVVRESYDTRTLFIEADPKPDPGTTDIWTFRNLAPGAHGQIVIKMKTKKSSCKANINGEVYGTGYASTRGLLSTNFESYLVTNSITISSGGPSGESNLSASVTTRVRPIDGFALAFGEHGSGSYSSDEKLSYSPSSISVYRSINGSGSPASILLSRQTITLPPGWFAGLQGENTVRDIRWDDQFYQTDLLNLSYRLQLSKSQSSLETASHFRGWADLATAWPGAETDQRFSGEYNLLSKAWAKWSSKGYKTQDAGLECCPLIEGWQEQDSDG